MNLMRPIHLLTRKSPTSLTAQRSARALAAVGLAIPLLAPTLAGAEIPIDSNTFGALRARAIGPAEMSGRISSLDAVPGPPVTLWVGTASGGVWKSEDAGITFEPVFDDHTQSIGAVRVDPSDPDVVWVGTGESWVRNSVSLGDGIYKTTDGGESWKHVGLPDSERVAQIVINPHDTDTVFVCATGRLWSAGGERGVWRTTDGGESWENVLSVDEDTGCSDIDMDPQEPDVLYAGMWQFRREPDFFTSGGPGSGLYKSTDGGETWDQLENGLPEGEKGRISVTVAPSRPSVVYAIVEAEDTALYRSDDLGATWRQVSNAASVAFRPFYFGEIVVDPTDHLRVYRPAFTFTQSTDGGKSFSALFGAGFSISVHPDHHALWVNPKNPNMLVLGTDGGVYVSNDRSRTWRHVKSLPVSQFYRVAHDNQWPYNVYGGLQDNGSWRGPSRMPGGIRNKHWDVVGGGDGFWTLPDPHQPDVVYYDYQGGELFRVNMRLQTSKSIKVYPQEGQPKLRFNWNTPVVLSTTQPGTMYVGSQFLHRSRDRGDSWETISPDLTTNDPARQRQADSGGLTSDNTTAENNTTIYSISESPRDGQIIWVGTDDGNVQVTRNGGEDWADVTANITSDGTSSNGPASGGWVSSVHASPHAAGTAFVTIDDHRRGDMAPYAFRTDDFGASWTPLIDEEKVDGYAWILKQDPVNADLLFLGTEHGLWLTLDGGTHWARFKENMPPVAVHDLAIHPTEHDLILGTHGRGVYIIDDITPIRHLTAEALEANVTLLPSRPGYQVLQSTLFNFSGAEEFVGEVPSPTVGITYFLKKRHLFGDLKVEIFDQEDNLLVTLPGGKRRGLNRVEWPMFLKAPKVPPANSLIPAFTGPRVPEGTYKVRLTKGKEVIDGQIRLVPDPRNPHSDEDRALQQTTALAVYDRLADLTYLVESLDDLASQARDQAEALASRRKAQEQLESFATDLEALTNSLAVQEGTIFSGGEALRERMGILYGEIVGFDGRPGGSQQQQLANIEAEMVAAKEQADSLLTTLSTINTTLSKEGKDPLERMSREAWEAKDSRAGSATGPAGARWVRDRFGLLMGISAGQL